MNFEFEMIEDKIEFFEAPDVKSNFPSRKPMKFLSKYKRALQKPLPTCSAILIMLESQMSTHRFALIRPTSTSSVVANAFLNAQHPTFWSQPPIDNPSQRMLL